MDESSPCISFLNSAHGALYQTRQLTNQRLYFEISRSSGMSYGAMMAQWAAPRHPVYPLLSSLPPAPVRSHHQRRDRHFGGDEGRKRRSVRPSVRPCDRGPPRRRSGRASVRPSVFPPLFSAGGIKSEHPRTQRTLHHDKTIGLCRCNDAGLLHRPPPSVKEVRMD